MSPSNSLNSTYTMASTKPQPPKKIQDCDLYSSGDLVLIVGTENPTRIGVSSAVLKLASPVMAAMLSSTYSEGRALAQKGTLELTLLEDDPEAMLQLCKAFHMKLAMTSIKVSLLEKMAILCDKYDASLALSAWSESWLAYVDGSLHGQDRFPRVLWISYALGSQSSFWHISQQMMLEYNQANLLGMEAELLDTCLPRGIIGKSL